MHLKIHLEREELPDRSQDMWRERENGENEKKKRRIGFFFFFFNVSPYIYDTRSEGGWWFVEGGGIQ